MKFVIFLVVLLATSILGDSSEETEDEDTDNNDEKEHEYDEEEEEEGELDPSTPFAKVNVTNNRPIEDFCSLNRRFSSQIYKVFTF